MTPALSDDPRQVFDRVPFMRLLGLQRERSEGRQRRRNRQRGAFMDRAPIHAHVARGAVQPCA